MPGDVAAFWRRKVANLPRSFFPSPGIIFKGRLECKCRAAAGSLTSLYWPQRGWLAGGWQQSWRPSRGLKQGGGSCTSLFTAPPGFPLLAVCPRLGAAGRDGSAVSRALEAVGAGGRLQRLEGCDAADMAAMQRLARRTRILVSCCGDYVRTAPVVGGLGRLQW